MTFTAFADEQYNDAVASLTGMGVRQSVITPHEFHVYGSVIKTLPSVVSNLIDINKLYRYFYENSLDKYLEGPSTVDSDDEKFPLRIISLTTLARVADNANWHEEYPIDALLHSYLEIENL